MRLVFVSAFTLIVAACGGGGSEPPTPVLNAAPVVSTSATSTATEGTEVTVTATASDPNGDSFTILWTQISGPPITVQR